MSTIGFIFKPSVALLNLESMELSWIQNMHKDHPMFQQLSRVDSFDYYFLKDILVIPDPIPIPRYNWNKNVCINTLEIECKGSFLAFFKFNKVYDDVLIAESLTLPQYEFLKNSIHLG